jgi:hypothetical protein
MDPYRIAALTRTVTRQQAAGRSVGCVLLARPPSLLIDERRVLVIGRPRTPGPQRDGGLL